MILCKVTNHMEHTFFWSRASFAVVSTLLIRSHTGDPFEKWNRCVCGMDRREDIILELC